MNSKSKLSFFTNSKWHKQSSLLNVLVFFIAFVAVNFISSQFSFRLDLTEGKLYTLSAGSKEIVRELDQPTTIKLFFSAENKGVPQPYRIYAKRVEEILKEYVALNPQNLKLEILDPKPDSDEELAANGYKLAGADLGTAYQLFFGLAVVRGDKQEVLPFFDLRRQRFLEYDITQRIYRVTQKKKLVVGVMNELNVGGIPFQPETKWTMYDELSKFYDVRSFTGDTHEIEDNIDILLVFHPKNLVLNPDISGADASVSLKTEYAIDQFLLRKGKVMVIVDPFMRTDDQSLPGTRKFVSASDLPNLFKHWGVNYEVQSIEADFERAHVISAGNRSTPYLLWHSLKSSSFANDIPAFQNLNNALFAEPGAIDFAKKDSNTEQLNWKSFITTSNKTGTYPSRFIFNSSPSSINRSVNATDKTTNLAGLLSGKFTSAFKERPKLAGDPKFTQEHLVSSDKEASVIVASDADWIADAFSVRRFRILNQTIVQPSNDNLALFLNMVEYLSGSAKLFSIRSRGKFDRPFIKIIDLEKQSQANYKALEDQLRGELQQIQQQISQLKPKSGSNEIILNKDQVDKIRSFQTRERETKVKLREIRKLLRQDIEFLESTLKVINLVVVPALVLFSGLFIFYKRYYRRKRTR